MTDAWETTEKITAAREEFEGAIEGYAPPAAYAVGVGTVGPSGAVLDTRYPVVNCGEHHLPAAVVATVVGHVSGTATYPLTGEALVRAIGLLAPAEACPDYDHPNLAAWRALVGLAEAPAPLGGDRVFVASFIGDLTDPIIDAHDAYFRLHLLSHRAVAPHGTNMDGIFGALTNVVWTNLGPFETAGFETMRLALSAAGHAVTVLGVDKFPRLLDYVVPTGVRVADASRVRLGAHLADGTVVMHEGFCNFNAGTLGASMVEGRISAGVVVGRGSDVGGGASIMGTLSGGGKERITVGEDCLIGANAGIGISLGDRCIVEAGLYVTAGTIVTLPDGDTMKARELSGHNDVLFRRNSVTGAVEVQSRRPDASWAGLNTALHAN